MVSLDPACTEVSCWKFGWSQLVASFIVLKYLIASTDSYSCTSFAKFIYVVICTNPSLVHRLFVILSTSTPVRGNEHGCDAIPTPFQANFALCSSRRIYSTVSPCSTITWLYQYSPGPSCQVEVSGVQTRLWRMVGRVCHSTVNTNLGLRKGLGVSCTSHCILPAGHVWNACLAGPKIACVCLFVCPQLSCVQYLHVYQVNCWSTCIMCTCTYCLRVPCLFPSWWVFSSENEMETSER